MTNRPDTTEILADLVNRWDLLAEIQAAAYEPASSGRGNLSGVRGGTGDGSTMRALHQLETIRGIRLDLETLAHEWGWQPTDPDHRHYLLARWPWARDHMPADTADRILDIHTRFLLLVKEAPLKADRSCPSCGSPLRETLTGNYHCASCDLVRDPDEIRALTIYRLTTTGQVRTTPKEAAEILQVPAQTIYSWIRRGRLDKTDGLVCLAEAQRLTSLGDPDNLVHNETRATHTH